MPLPVTPEECARVLKAMADETRLKILSILFEGEKSVTEIVEVLGVDQPHASHHLAILRRAGLVEDERRGRLVVNRLHPAVYDSIAKSNSIDLSCCSIQFNPQFPRLSTSSRKRG